MVTLQGIKVNVAELLLSTYKLGYKRQPSYVFSKKPLGSIYAYNKTVLYKEKSSIIEISMLMGVATEKNRTAHRISIALQGVETKSYTIRQMANLVRKQRNLPKETTDAQIIESILQQNIQFLEGKTIIQSLDKDKFIVIDNKIPLTTETRVKCSCSDFLYTFAYYNADHKVLIGKRPPKYKKYVDITKKQASQPSFKPVRNPQKLAGACKHLFVLFALLMQGGLLAKAVPITSSFKKNSNKIENLMLGRQDTNKLLAQLNAELNSLSKNSESQNKTHSSNTSRKNNKPKFR